MSDLKNLNEIFRKNAVTYDNIKSHKKARRYPFLRKYSQIDFPQPF